MDIFTLTTGWSRIPDFLAPNDDSEDFEVTLARQGFQPHAAMTLAGDEGGMAIDVFVALREGSDQRPRFVVLIHLGGYGTPVACPGLPDVLGLLKEYTPLVEGVARLGDRQEAILATEGAARGDSHATLGEYDVRRPVEANQARAAFAIADALRGCSTALKYLGNGDASTSMGAIENLAGRLYEGLSSMSSSIDGLTGMVEAVDGSLGTIDVTIAEISRKLGE